MCRLKTKIKKLLLSSSLLSVILFLSACTRLDDGGHPTGWFYELFVIPTQGFIDWIADLLGGGYGWAIIIFTILVRLIILPLSIKQQKAMTKQQAKMKSVEPITKEIQEDMQNAESKEEQLLYQQELSQVYQEAGISLTGGMGCLPLLIQLPIISMVFSAIRYSPEIAQATFMGQSLGERSIILAILAGLVYLIQSYFMIQSVPEEQQSQMKMTALMSPAMIFIFSLSSPAGIALYWLVGGIFAIGQSYYTSNHLKPRLMAEAKEEAGDININRKRPARKEVNENQTKKSAHQSSSLSKFDRKSGRRNEGLQNRNHEEK